MPTDRLFGVPILLWIAFFAFADLMLAFPELDLAISRLFFDPQAGFAINGLWWERLLYHSLDLVLMLVLIAVPVAWWRGRQRAKRHGASSPTSPFRSSPNGRQILLLLALLALVPGLLVNQGLKEHLGRARPVDLAEFGGTKSFTPAFVPSTQDGGSFSSGHAAAAFFIVAVAAELRSMRSAWFVFALGYAVMIGLIRIASGGHFLSDVLTSAFLVWIGYWMLFAKTESTKSSAI